MVQLGSECIAARIFQRGGRTLSRGHSLDCHYGQDIVMAFSPAFVGRLVKKGLKKEGGHGRPRTPLATPLYSHTQVRI